MNSILIELTPIVGKALEVIAGLYGVGDERKKKLESEGYDYTKIQNCVNDLMKIMNKYGGD